MSFTLEVQSALAPILERHGFVLVDSAESGAFGDTYVVFQSNGLRLRILRDKGQVRVDFGAIADPGEWYDASFVAEYLDGRVNSDFIGTKVLARLSNYVDQNYARLVKAFSVDKYQETKKEVRRLHQRWEYEALGRPLPDSK